MEILDPGHDYLVKNYDGSGNQNIIFMKRIGIGYPFNEGEPHKGTNCQELLRVLIDRVKYLDKQVPCQDNKRILNYLRKSILEFERRAVIRHGETDLYPLQLWDDGVEVENIKTCETCGHIICKGHISHG